MVGVWPPWTTSTTSVLQPAVSSFQYDSLSPVQLVMAKDELLAPGPEVKPAKLGNAYVVALHVKFEVSVTVEFTDTHWLHTPSVGVTGHVQLLAGQMAPSWVELVWRTPAVMSDSYFSSCLSENIPHPAVHDQLVSRLLGLLEVPS
jgi:hypothetical protein